MGDPEGLVAVGMPNLASSSEARQFVRSVLHVFDGDYEQWYDCLVKVAAIDRIGSEFGNPSRERILAALRSSNQQEKGAVHDLKSNFLTKEYRTKRQEFITGIGDLHHANDGIKSQNGALTN